MIKLGFSNGLDSISKVLCLGSHCDDIEIGCGGTVLRLIESYKNLEFYWIVFSSDKERAQEATTSANLFLENAKTKNILIKSFRDSFFPFVGDEIKDFFEGIKEEMSPDIIFTHYRNDLHQDHRLISDLTWNTFRDHLILEYETPKYDGDLGSPNLFMHLDKAICHRKVEYILKTFNTQRQTIWFDKETFFSILRLRGIESNSLTKYAEGFYCRKMVLRCLQGDENGQR